MAIETFPTIDPTYPELIIGIVSPVGARLISTLAALKEELSAKNYETHHIKISSFFPNLAKEMRIEDLKSSPRYERIDSHINFGNLARNQLGARIFSAYAISEIVEKRNNNEKTKGTAYIIDQLKTVEELNLLREVYGQSFFQISVYSARDVRVDNLSKQMAHDNKKRDSNFFRADAEKLVARDEDEANEPNGQRVGKIFQYADIVVNDDNADERSDVKYQVSRFVDLLFGHNGYSPNRLEYGMYLAHSAALRSLDLSRQVGAAIFRKTGEIAALGANEVPKAGGGTYWAEEIFDAREYRLSSDSNDVRKEELLDEVIQIVCSDKSKLSKSQLAQLQKSQFMDALEYGRIIHAEMSAISDAARLGISLQDATLYCTTFPCHMCAKHIVATGISKVVFLEPYPKSLTPDLHSDAVKIEGMSRGPYSKFPFVEFTPFFGITPRRYREFFSRSKRKSSQGYETYKNSRPWPMIKNEISTYLPIEKEIIEKLIKSVKALQKDDTTEIVCNNIDVTKVS